nr:adenine deaminase [Telmatospirillum sp. J64-1]
MKPNRLSRRIDQALGARRADLVIKGAQMLNVTTGEIVKTDIAICDDVIVGTYEAYEGEVEIDAAGRFAVPGFIDTHVHCESSLVTPFEFDRSVLPHGTTTAICDPHEIANVLGRDGVRYFLDAAAALAMDLRVQLPSCVPATDLETSGASLTAEDLLALRDHPKVLGLAEFMNYPGVLSKDPQVMEKLEAFQGGIIDGHSPLLGGRELNAYLSCGIRNCHESTSREEGLEKLRKGMHLLIREGTVSKDLRELAPLIDARTATSCSFCTDDRNPLDIFEEGHLDHLIRLAIAEGVPTVEVYRAASWTAAQWFGLSDRGVIAPGKRADIVLLDSLEECRVSQVLSAGRVVDDALFAARPRVEPVGLDSIKRAPITEQDLAAPASSPEGPVIGIRPGQIVTEHLTLALPYKDGCRLADPERDVLKVCVLERHGKNGNIGRGFVKGLGLREGAIASSVGHDSHNLCVTGANDADMVTAVNRLIALGGGFVAVRGGEVMAELPLSIAGLMSDKPFEAVRDDLEHLRKAVRALGSQLPEPFLQLAFLALPVIPHLKITDMGLVDVDRFCVL